MAGTLDQEPRAQIESTGDAKSELGSFEAYLKKAGYGSLEAALTSAKFGAVDAKISQEDFRKVANKVLTAIDLAAKVVAKVIQTTEVPANATKKMSGLSELALIEVRESLKKILADKGVNIYDDKLIVTQPDGTTGEVPIASLMLHNGAELFIETIAYIEAAKLGKKDWKLAQQKMAELALHPAVDNINAFTEKVAQLKKDNPQLEPVINHETTPPEFVLTAEEAAELAKLTGRTVPVNIFTKFSKLVHTFDEQGTTSLAEVLPAAHEKVLRLLLEKLGEFYDELEVGTYNKSEYPYLLADSNGRKRYEQMLEYLQDVDRKNNIIKATKKTSEQEMQTMLDAWEAAVFHTIRINNLRLPTYLSGLEATLQAHPDGLDQDEKPYLLQALERVREVQTGGINYADPAFNEAFRQKKEEKKREWEQRIVGLLGKVKEAAAEADATPSPEDDPRKLTAEQITETSTKGQPPDVLMAWSRTLGEVLFSRLTLTSDQQKMKFNNKYEEIINIFNKIPEYEYWGQYLDDRRNLYNALAIGTSSNWTVNYDDMLKGSPPGWLGVGVQSAFSAAVPMRLLYGSEIDTDLRSRHEDERERIKVVNNVLEICCEMLSEVQADGSVGPYHATQLFSDGFKPLFTAEVKRRLMEEDLQVSQLTDDQNDGFGLGMELMAFLDLRTYYAYPYFLAGWSPPSGDGIGDKALSPFAARFTGLKDLYNAIGKITKGFVVPELMVRKIPDVVRNAVANEDQKINNLALSEYATALYWEMYAESLDADEENDDAKVVYYTDRVLMMPLMCELLWVPRTRYVKEVNGKIVPAKKGEAGARRSTRKDSPSGEVAFKEVLKTVKTVIGEKSGVTLKGAFDGATASEKFVDLCQKGFPISEDAHKDVKMVKQNVSELAQTISPTKALGSTVDARRLANYLYMYSRFSLLAFSEKHEQAYKDKGKSDEYWGLYLEFMENLRTGILSAATLQINIDNVPLAFRRKYGFDDNKPINIRDYVLRLLPEPVITRFSRTATANKNLSSAVKDKILASVQIEPGYYLSNELAFAEAKEEYGTLYEDAKKKLSHIKKHGPNIRVTRMLRSRLFRHPRTHHGTDARIHGDFEKDRVELLKAIELPPLTANKQKEVPAA